jgi:DNA-binding NarL/FixJ family response regulator
MNRARILLADDHDLILHGCRATLEIDYEIVGTAADGKSLVESALRLNPDLVMLDISMPLLNGLEAARQIKTNRPEIKLVFFTMHSERLYLQAAFEAGASGYLLKSDDHSKLRRAVREILEGKIYVPESFPPEFRKSQDSAQLARALALTPREQQILQLIAEGSSTKEIAHTVHVSVKTVEYHKEHLKRKLGVTTLAGLIRNAIAGGFS